MCRPQHRAGHTSHTLVTLLWASSTLGKSIVLPLGKHALESPASMPLLVPTPCLASMPTAPRPTEASPSPPRASAPLGLCLVLYMPSESTRRSCQHGADRPGASQCRSPSTYCALGTALSTPGHRAADASQEPGEVCSSVPSSQMQTLRLRVAELLLGVTKPGNGASGNWASFTFTSPLSGPEGR